MAKLSSEERAMFPLTDIKSVVKLFTTHLNKNKEPNLAILSIIVGHIENTLTCARGAAAQETSLTSSLPVDYDDCATAGGGGGLQTDRYSDVDCTLPVVEYKSVEALYHRFLAIIKAHVDVTAFGTPKYATRELVKRISDVVWCTLSSSYYKDRAHLQSIYSYMTGAKLDSSGTTLAVVAACQALGYNDVHLALSEDHTWVVFGEKGQHTVEVTWHGKGNEDKRGIPVTDEVYSKSWLYVNGQPVICDRYMEVATIVSNMNPGISATTDSEEVMLLQQALLWSLYDAGHLAKYPMAIDNLGDLEEMMPTKGRQPATKMYEEAITSAVRYYDNQHVYPYTYLGGYCYRNKLYKQALKYWAKAASVIKNYNYSRDDEEIYKEFLEIANELIPHIMRVVSSGISARSILKDPECFAYLIEFYDGICEWEEGSATPVLHIGWAKALFNTISKFDAHVRSHVKMICIDPDSSDNGDLQGSAVEKAAAAEARTSQDQNGNMATDCINLTEEDIDPSESPTLHLYTGYDAKKGSLGTACAPKTLSNERFWNALNPKSHRWSINATDFAHADFLDDEFKVFVDKTHFCAVNEDLVEEDFPKYRQFVAGTAVAFFKALLEEDYAYYLNYLEDVSVMPIAATERHFTPAGERPSPYCKQEPLRRQGST